MSDTLVLFASSRENGNSRAALNSVLAGRSADVIDISQQNISFYDYEHANQADDFLSIAERMTKASTLVFVTPVYWYTMSAQLKMFFDRFTDLITIRKDLGRALAGRTCYVLCSGSDPELPQGFEQPFTATFDYMDMEYGGCFYFYAGKNEALKQANSEKALAIGAKIFNNA